MPSLALCSGSCFCLFVRVSRLFVATLHWCTGEPGGAVESMTLSSMSATIPHSHTEAQSSFHRILRSQLEAGTATSYSGVKGIGHVVRASGFLPNIHDPKLRHLRTTSTSLLHLEREKRGNHPEKTIKYCLGLHQTHQRKLQTELREQKLISHNRKGSKKIA